MKKSSKWRRKETLVAPLQNASYVITIEEKLQKLPSEFAPLEAVNEAFTIWVDHTKDFLKLMARTGWKGIREFILLPIVFLLFMLLTYPLLLYKAMYQILVDLIKFNFKASEIQKANKPLVNYKSYKKAAHYSCQLVFQKNFEDREKLEAIFQNLVAEAGMDPDVDCVIDWRDDEEPASHYDENHSKIAGDHYVGEKGSNFKIDGRIYRNYKLALAMFEKRATSMDDRETTVMQAHLPGLAWDGTSCFNFVKELVSRYYGIQNSNVFRADEIISMSPDAAATFDDKLSILRFIASVPLSIFKNTCAMQYMKSKHVLGYPESCEGDRLFCMLNLSVDESAKLAKALKAHSDGRVAPTAALIYSAVTAYKEETGELPYCVPIQASLQTRAYEPLVKDRSFVGDWLIAPLHKIRAAGLRRYTLADSQQAYETLLEELASCGNFVKRAFYARVFGVVKGGAAAFEKAPTYADSNCLCDSLFFNNYGVRTICEDSKCVSFNWSGAGKLNCNCILLNGRICIVFASQILPLPRLERIRDSAARSLAALANDNINE